MNINYVRYVSESFSKVAKQYQRVLIDIYELSLRRYANTVD